MISIRAVAAAVALLAPSALRAQPSPSERSRAIEASRRALDALGASRSLSGWADSGMVRPISECTADAIRPPREDREVVCSVRRRFGSQRLTVVGDACRLGLNLEGDYADVRRTGSRTGPARAREASGAHRFAWATSVAVADLDATRATATPLPPFRGDPAVLGGWQVVLPCADGASCAVRTRRLNGTDDGRSGDTIVRVFIPDSATAHNALLPLRDWVSACSARRR